MFKLVFEVCIGIFLYLILGFWIAAVEEPEEKDGKARMRRSFTALLWGVTLLRLIARFLISEIRPFRLGLKRWWKTILDSEQADVHAAKPPELLPAEQIVNEIETLELQRTKIDERIGVLRSELGTPYRLQTIKTDESNDGFSESSDGPPVSTARRAS